MCHTKFFLNISIILSYKKKGAHFFIKNLGTVHFLFKWFLLQMACSSSKDDISLISSIRKKKCMNPNLLPPLSPLPCIFISMTTLLHLYHQVVGNQYSISLSLAQILFLWLISLSSCISPHQSSGNNKEGTSTS